MRTELSTVFTIFYFKSRQNGLGFCSFMARIGVSMTTLIFLLEDVWGHMPSLIFGLVALAASLVTLFFPETKNIRLPETIEDVEQTRCQNHFWVKAPDAFFPSLFSIFILFSYKYRCSLCYRRRSTLMSEEKEMSYSELKTEVPHSNE